MSVKALKSLSTFKDALATAARAMCALEEQLRSNDVSTVLDEETVSALEELDKRFMHEAEAEENPVARRAAFDEAACMVRKARRAIESKPLAWLVVWQVIPESTAIYSVDFSAMTTDQRLATMDTLELCAGHHIGEVGLPANVDSALATLSEFLKELTPIWDSNNGDHYGTFCTLEQSVYKVIVTGQIL
jgi:hypothetical protein